jgi:hypothetical protein
MAVTSSSFTEKANCDALGELLMHLQPQEPSQHDCSPYYHNQAKTSNGGT